MGKEDITQVVNAAFRATHRGWPAKATLYVAGPMTGRVDFNFPAFDKARNDLLDAGYNVISPADIDRLRGFNGTCELPAEGFTLEECLEYDKAAIDICDGIALMSGWENSAGVAEEMAYARTLERFIRTNTVDDWMQNGYLLCPATPVRTFPTGATRDTDEGKLDFDGFLSAAVLEKFAEYMHKHRKLADGTLRASDDWKKGLPRDVYRKSTWRHFFAWWKAHQLGEDTVEQAMGILFNVMGDTHEALKGKV
jgi:hypothetical protein